MTKVEKSLFYPGAYLSTTILLMWLFVSNTSAQPLAGSESDRKALEQTSIGIRSAFANGDVETILSYHHPEVHKALGYDHIINGRDELKIDLQNTLQNLKLTWLENNVESLIIEGNTAIEMTAYTIEGTPKDGSKPFVIKGRAMVVYVRYKQSPSGWASVRELIQPAN